MRICLMPITEREIDRSNVEQLCFDFLMFWCEFISFLPCYDGEKTYASNVKTGFEGNITENVNAIKQL